MRAFPLLFVAGFVVITACKKSDDTATNDSTDENTNRSVKCNQNTCKNDDYCCGSDGFGDANCSVVCDNQHALYCDDATDCPTGTVCCYVSANGSITSSSCQTQCAGSTDRGQLCSLTGPATECGTGKACRGLAIAPSGLNSCQ